MDRLKAESETLEIKREIKILQNLCGGPNIVKLLDIVRHQQWKTPSLIFEHVNSKDFKVLYPTLSDYDVRYHIYELLKALDQCSDFIFYTKEIVQRFYILYSISLSEAESLLQIFRKEPFFYGHDNYDQLVKIAKVLGTYELNNYLVLHP